MNDGMRRGAWGSDVIDRHFSRHLPTRDPLLRETSVSVPSVSVPSLPSEPWAISVCP